MKLLLGTLLTIAAVTNVFANNKVIYGKDHRVDAINASYQYQELARSTAAMIPANKLALNHSTGTYDLDTNETLQARGICASERFAKQPTVALCSGFLIADDILVTAGHCIKSMSDCQRNKWVFDYKTTAGTGPEVDTTKGEDTVYNCKEILSQKLENSGQDYAVIRLERKVTDREPLKFRKNSMVTVGTEIVVIGHPSGLPTKVAGGAKVREIEANGFFRANLDTYGGNSGSAVFNAITGEVEGILVRGEQDYKYNAQTGCMESNYCEVDGCRGEDVTTITSIPFIQNL